MGSVAQCCGRQYSSDQYDYERFAMVKDKMSMQPLHPSTDADGEFVAVSGTEHEQSIEQESLALDDCDISVMNTTTEQRQIASESLQKTSLRQTLSTISLPQTTGFPERSLSYDTTLLTPIPSDYPMRSKMEPLASSLSSCEEEVDNETIEMLISMELPDDIQDILGDPTSYILPDQQIERSHIECDLQKIKVPLFEYKVEETEQRKYAKLCILKYYDLLTSIYRRYCKIARDTQWMTMFGWMSLLRDCGTVTNPDDEQQYIDIFHSVYQYHNQNYHNSETLSYGVSNLKDNDPWTGLWILQADDETEREDIDGPEASGITKASSCPSTSTPRMSGGTYKVRKIGDRKVIGCINDSRLFPIAGWLNDQHDFKKAKLQLSYPKPTGDKLVLHCTLVVPQSMGDDLDDPLQMKVNWEHSKKGSQHTKKGSVRLFKSEGLEDNDEDLPIANYVGLSRHEFLDALLCIGRMTDNQRPLYELFHELIESHLYQYLFQNMVDLRRFLKGQEIEKKLHSRLRSNQSLIRLFGRYSAINKNTGYVEEDAWSALTEDLYAIANDVKHGIWKYGGKPTTDQVTQCFTLSKPADSMDELWMCRGEFYRCLIYFTAALFRNQPDAEYKVLPFEKKLDLVLKWCHKLDSQHKETPPDTFRSPSLSLVQQKSPSPFPPSAGYGTISVIPDHGSSDAKKGQSNEMLGI